MQPLKPLPRKNRDQQPSNFKEYWAQIKVDILLFFKLINFDATSDQKEIALSVQDAAINPTEVPEQILVKAGTGTGKTAAVAAMALWLLMRTWYTVIIVTAPTERQVRTVLLKEIRKHLSRAPQWFQDMFDIHLTKVNVKGHDDWQILPITASEATSVQGQHDRGLWIIAEEVSGIADDILDAFMRTLSQLGNGFIGIGNPNHRQGLLFRAFTSQAHLWPRKFTMNKIRLSQERPEIADPRGIQKILEQYGPDSFQYRVGCEGEFPLTEGQTVMDYAAIQRAVTTSKHLAIKNASNPRLRRISNDFARYGGDNNVIAALAGNAVVEFEKLVCEPYDAVQTAFWFQEKRGWKDHEVTYVPDAVGMGQSLLVLYERAGKTWIPYGSHYSSPDPMYENAESCAWFQLKRLMETEDVALPDDPELLEQLATRTYKYMPSTNKIKVESKAEYKVRTKQASPDESDAIVQLFYNPLGENSGEVLHGGGPGSSFRQQQTEVLVPGSWRDQEEGPSQRPGASPMDIFYS